MTENRILQGNKRTITDLTEANFFWAILDEPYFSQPVLMAEYVATQKDWAYKMSKEEGFIEIILKDKVVFEVFNFILKCPSDETPISTTIIFPYLHIELAEIAKYKDFVENINPKIPFGKFELIDDNKLFVFSTIFQTDCDEVFFLNLINYSKYMLNQAIEKLFADFGYGNQYIEKMNKATDTIIENPLTQTKLQKLLNE